MKILVISSADTVGGAAIAAQLIDKSVNSVASDYQSHFSVGKKFSDQKNVFQSRINIIHQIENLFSKFQSLLGYQFSYLPFSTKGIMKSVEKLQPDIIHLHILHGGFFQTSLISQLSKIAPLVWTLHDMWAFTGHCDYSYECEKWKDNCNNCPNLSCHPPIGLDRTNKLFHDKKNRFNLSFNCSSRFCSI
jgi:hypothetical protein